MSRIRSIKPEFFTSEDIVALTPLARLFYIALWCEADREGRLAWKVKTLKMRYLPAEDCQIEDLAEELVESGLIELYEVEGKAFAHIPTFRSHQIINNRESESVLPPPPGAKRLRSNVTRAVDSSKSQQTAADEAADEEAEEQQFAAETAHCDPEPQQIAANRSNDAQHDACLTRESRGLGEGREGREGTYTSSGAAQNLLRFAFDRFWLAYPKKRNKGQAERAFAKLKPDEHLQETILAAVQRAKTRADWLKDDGQFIPYPATWLHSRGWEDEAASPGVAPFGGNPIFAGVE